MAHTALFERLQDAVRRAGEAAVRAVPVEQVVEEHRARAISRREFVERAAVLGAGIVLPTALGPARRAPAGPRIAVVGAGLAGLTCAYRLQQAGYAATVYEASGRLGGRCWTLRGAFAEGQIGEHGGELIDQSHKETRQLAQELGLVTDNLLAAEQNGTEPFHFVDGAPYSFREATNDIKTFWQKLHRDLSEASYPTTFDSFTPRGFQLDHMSIVDWINESVPGGMASRAGQLLAVAYNIEYGAEAGVQSALNLIYLLGFSGQGQLRIFGPSNEKYRVRGGNDQIVARLVERLAGQIETAAPLVAIARNSDGRFTLTFESGRSSRTVTVEQVVLALPFSILRDSVDFRRAGFTDIKLTAIRELQIGANAKLHVQFSRRHWRTLGCNGDTFADTGYQNTWEVSRAQAGTSGLLVDYTGGDIARGFHTGTPASRAQQFLGQIEPVLPGLAAAWNGRATIDYWPGQPWVKGAYSYWRVGEYTRFAGAEGLQQGNCHFCGEHTSIDSQGYLNGAVESGERAAREVLT